MIQDDRVRRLEEEVELLRSLLDAYDEMTAATGKHLADTGSIFEEYQGTEETLRAAVSGSARLGASMESAAKRGWRHNQLLKGHQMAASKQVTAKDIRKAFEGEDNPTARWVQNADNEVLQSFVEKLSSGVAIRAAVVALVGDQ